MLAYNTLFNLPAMFAFGLFAQHMQPPLLKLKNELYLMGRQYREGFHQSYLLKIIQGLIEGLVLYFFLSTNSNHSYTEAGKTLSVSNFSLSLIYCQVTIFNLKVLVGQLYFRKFAFLVPFALSFATIALFNVPFLFNSTVFINMAYSTSLIFNNLSSVMGLGFVVLFCLVINMYFEFIWCMQQQPTVYNTFSQINQSTTAYRLTHLQSRARRCSCGRFRRASPRLRAPCQSPPCSRPTRSSTRLCRKRHGSRRISGRSSG